MIIVNKKLLLAHANRHEFMSAVSGLKIGGEVEMSNDRI